MRYLCAAGLLGLLVIAQELGNVRAQQESFAQWDPRAKRSANPFWSGIWRWEDCPPEDPDCNIPPFYPYDEIPRDLPSLGRVIGRSMIYHPFKYINFFLGIQYARPPVRERRFMKPEQPGLHWDQQVETWDASYHRDVCPQELWHVEDMYYTHRNMSEDCLHLNIYSPNITGLEHRRYAVMVFLDGDDWKMGDSFLNPGHIVAEREIVVVTLNYRLGALGFMSTTDASEKYKDISPGNYGLWDIIMALEFIQKYIDEFGGDPDKVTLAGSNSGAAAAALLTLSPKSRAQFKPLFQQIILMGGSDLCEWSVIDDMVQEGGHVLASPLEYTKDLGREVGCDADYGMPIDMLVECLRYKHYEEIVNASAAVWKKYGSLAGPFGPVVDRDLLPKKPQEIRKYDKDQILPVNILAGFAREQGAYIVENITKDIPGLDMNEGMDQGTFRQILKEMIDERLLIRKKKKVPTATLR